MIESSDDTSRLKREGSRRAPDLPANLPDPAVFSLGPAGHRGPARVDAPSAGEPMQRNSIFETLVSSEIDIVGLVAYGLYKQSKRDWFIAFEKEHRRPPTAIEVRSYIVGETMERRLATYRHLAEETLAARPNSAQPGQLPAPLAHATPTNTLPVAQSRPADPRRRGLARGGVFAFAAYVALLALIVAGMAWLLRGGWMALGLGRW